MELWHHVMSLSYYYLTHDFGVICTSSLCLFPIKETITKRSWATVICFYTGLFMTRALDLECKHIITHTTVSWVMKHVTSVLLCENLHCWRNPLFMVGETKWCLCPATSGCRPTFGPSWTAAPPHKMPKAHKKTKPQMTSMTTKCSKVRVCLFTLSWECLLLSKGWVVPVTGAKAV